jgi:ankyrin repeat protein
MIICFSSVQVRTMLKDVKDIDDTSEGITPLEMAVQSDCADMVKLILEHGAAVDINRGFRSGILENPIRYTRNVDMVRLLLSNGVDPYKVHLFHSDNSTNAFIQAANECSFDPQDSQSNEYEKREDTPREIVRILLDHGNGLGAPETKGPYALFAAAGLGDTELLKKYFADGVRMERCYELKLCPLLKACKNKDKATAALLLEHGANPDEPDSHQLYETPLSIAMHDGHMDLVRLLLDNGADDAGKPIYDEGTMHQRDDRLTGLMFACAWGLLDVVKEVLSRRSFVLL